MQSRLNFKIFLTFLFLCFLVFSLKIAGMDSFLRFPLEKTALFWDSWQFFAKKVPLEKEKNCSFLESKVTELEKENSNMRKLLGAPLPSQWHFLPAKIIGRDHNDYLIDKGRNDKVVLGQAVISESFFAGKISFVGENIARFSSFDNPNLKVAVYLKKKDGGDVIGRGLMRYEAGKSVVDQILTDEIVEIGDLVLTAGENYVPSDLLIGRVVKLGKVSSVFQKAEVFPEVDQNDLQIVFLISYK